MLPAIRKKFSNIFWTALLIASLCIVLFLFYKTRTLYLEYLKFHRLQAYSLDVDDVDARFQRLEQIVNQVQKEFDNGHSIFRSLRTDNKGAPN